MNRILIETAKNIGELSAEEFRFLMSLEGITPHTTLVNSRYSTIYHSVLKFHRLDLLKICVNELGLKIKTLFEIAEDGITQLAKSESIGKAD